MAAIKKIPSGFIVPSAALCVPRSRATLYSPLDQAPTPGSLVYGVISRLGQHSALENKEGRIHAVNAGTRAIFVYGNRYAPDYYEALVPDVPHPEVDLVARSGIVARVLSKKATIKDPTRVRILGYVVDQDGQPLNTRRFAKLGMPAEAPSPAGRSKMILFVGTSMNAGKSTAAAACCWALSSMKHEVRASKVTGTASLKDILLMEDHGAHPVSDFTWLGHPSTYMLPENEVIGTFAALDAKYARKPNRYWIVEFADGLLQRETAMLLRSPVVKARIHKLVFCAGDAIGAIGGLRILKEQFGLSPDALSGRCSSSPLALGELGGFCDVPILDSMSGDLKRAAEILLGP